MAGKAKKKKVLVGFSIPELKFVANTGSDYVVGTLSTELEKRLVKAGNLSKTGE